jgi:Sortase domain
MRRSTWPSLLALAAGVACLTAASEQVAGARYPPASFGSTSAPASLPVSPPVASSMSEPSSSPEANEHGRGRTSKTIQSRFSSPPLAEPDELTIPQFGIKAHVVPVASHGDDLDVPPDAASVGWWTGSARPGAPAGSVILDGHVDSYSQGPGALYRLTELRVGDKIVLSSRTRWVTYRVIGRRVYTKSAALPRSLFEPTDTPRVVLISCAGRFDQQRRTYADNIAVFAVPE